MKVLIINGSPRINGNTSLAIKEMEKILRRRALRPRRCRSAIKMSEAASPADGAVSSEMRL